MLELEDGRCLAESNAILWYLGGHTLTSAESEPGRRVRKVNAGPRLLSIVAFVLVAECGEGIAPVDRAETGGAAGSNSTGGIGGGGVPPDGGGSGQDGRGSDGGDSSSDTACNIGILWNALSDAALGVVRLGYCLPATTTSRSGAIVLDDQGRVIDNTEISYQGFASKQAWLDSLAHDRWPCLAGQTIPYWCVAD